MPLRLQLATHSETGLVRKNNQDSGYASQNLVVVADGMGGAAAGDLASAVAVDTIKHIDAPAGRDEMLELLTTALHRANDRIADLIEDDYSLEGMGTTVTGALFDGTAMGLAHIGDSRAYLLRDGRLERLTHDHSWVQSLVDDGKITEAEAAVHPHRSLLLRVLNGQSANEPDLTMVNLQVGDRLLFCSDGLCGLVDDDAIADAMRDPGLDQALAHLVDLAYDAGGIDNITVILADVVDRDGTDERVVLGAAAERDVPPAISRAQEPDEDTIVTDRTALEEHAEPPAHVPPADDEARYNPRAPHQRRLLKPLLITVAALVILAAGLGAGYAWTRTQYYVGASGNQVAIFQGVSDAVPGVDLSTVYEVQPLELSALPPYYRQKVLATIDVASLVAARQTVAELNDAAVRCAGKKPGTPSMSPTPSAHPTKPGPTAKTSPSPVATPTATPNPEPTC